MSESISVAEYYARPGVRERVREYCGATPAEPPTCVYLSAISTPVEARRGWAAAPRYPPDALDHLLASGADVARSMWDREHLLVHFDLDYLNIDYPGEPFLHPADTFLKLEPTLQATRHVLHGVGLHALTLMTGRGYHFTGRCRSTSRSSIGWRRSHPRRRRGGRRWRNAGPDG